MCAYHKILIQVFIIVTLSYLRVHKNIIRIQEANQCIRWNAWKLSMHLFALSISAASAILNTKLFDFLPSFIIFVIPIHPLNYHTQNATELYLVHILQQGSQLLYRLLFSHLTPPLCLNWFSWKPTPSSSLVFLQSMHARLLSHFWQSLYTFLSTVPGSFSHIRLGHGIRLGWVPTIILG